MSETATPNYHSLEFRAEAARRVVLEKWERSTYGNGDPAEKGRRRVVIDGQPVAYLSLPNGWRRRWQLVRIDGKQCTYVPSGTFKGDLASFHDIHKGVFGPWTLADLLKWRLTGGLPTIEELQTGNKAELERVLATQRERRDHAIERKAKVDASIWTLRKLLAGEAVDEAERRTALEDAIKRLTDSSDSEQRFIDRVNGEPGINS